MCKVRTRNCASNSWPHSLPRSGSDDWRHAVDSSRTRGGSSAHREGEGYRPEHQAGRSDELLVCAAVACRADELGGVPRPFALGRWARTSRGRSRSPTGSLGLRRARASACSGVRQRLARASACPPIHWSGKYRPASVRFSTYRSRLGWREC